MLEELVCRNILGRLVKMMSFFALLALLSPGASAQSHADLMPSAGEYDVIIRGGHIVDGSGNPWYAADIAVRGDRIAAIGKLKTATAKRVIDATGLVVAPGFIDMLGQSELALLIDNRSLSKLSQGITTEVTGEGASIAPQDERTLGPMQPLLKHFGVSVDWSDLDGYFRRLERGGTPINLGTYVGAAQVREAVMGDMDRPPTPNELQEMKSLVARAMKDGALGVSSSLIYPPGHYAKTDELVALAKVAAEYGGIYATHMRSEGQSEKQALEETIRIGREAGLPVEIFHLKVAGKLYWGRMPEIVATIQAARVTGVDIAADMYPYLAGATTLASALPPWVADGGMDKLLSRLRDPVTRERIAKQMRIPQADWENLYHYSGGGSGVRVSSVLDPELKKYTGMTIADVAKDQHKQELDALFDLILADKGKTEALYFMVDENDLQYALTQSWTSIGLDANETSPNGLLFQAHIHPRAWGSLPRFLGHYCRDLRLLPLETAIRKITSLPAQRANLAGRGLLKPGFFADITIFDPASITDAATYAEPNQMSRGVAFVFVNGQLEFDNGCSTGAMAGRPLRGPGWQRADPSTTQ